MSHSVLEAVQWRVSGEKTDVQRQGGPAKERGPRKACTKGKSMPNPTKRYAFDLTRPLHRYVWQMGGILGRFSLILDSLGVVGLGLAAAGLLTMAFAENDRILELGLKSGVIALCAGISCFASARLVDFIGKFLNGEDPRSLILTERQKRATDFRVANESSTDAVWRQKNAPSITPMNVQTLRIVGSEPPTDSTAPPAKTGTTDRP